MSHEEKSPEYERAKIYELDVISLADLMTRLKREFQNPFSELVIEDAVLKVWNKHDYPVGTLAWDGEEGQFNFILHEDRFDGS